MTSPSSPLTLYIDWMSQPSRAVALLLLENSIPHTIRLVNIAKGDTRSSWFKEVNPSGKVPAIVDHAHGDLHLSESATIMRFICATRSVAPHWYPADPIVRARVDEMLDWHHGNLRIGSTKSLFATVFGPQLGSSPETLRIVGREGSTVLKKSLEFMDKVLETREFIAGTAKPTLADLQLSQETVMLPFANFSYREYPHVVRWMERMERDINNWGKATAVLNKVQKLRAERAAKTASPNTSLSPSPTSASSSDSVPSLTSSWSAHAKSFRCLPIFDTMKAHLSDSKEGAAAAELQSKFRYEVSADGDAKRRLVIVVDLKGGSGFGYVREGEEGENTNSDATFAVSDSNFIALSSGRLSGPMAYTTGKFKVSGNLQKAMAWNTKISRAQEKVKETILKHGLEKNTKGNKSKM